MNKTLISAIMFTTGAAIGSLVTWKVVETKYSRIAQEEIDSVKEEYKRVMDLQRKEVELYRKASSVSQNDSEEETDDEYYPDDDARDFTHSEQEQIDYYKLIGKYHGTGNADDKEYYIEGVDEPEEVDYGKEGDEGSEDLVQFVNGPYVISPEEFGDKPGFNSQPLDYFADGVLADGWGVELDLDETIGEDAIKHFGEYVDDIVYVRNERTEIDYEVTRDPRTYEEAVRTNPNPYYGHDD